MGPGAEAALITVTVLSLLLAVALAALWRAEHRHQQRRAMRQGALIARYRHRVVDLRQAVDEWRAEAHRREVRGQDMHDRWRAEEERSRALRYQLDALTVGRPTQAQVAQAALTPDAHPDGDGGWQMAQEVRADIARLDQPGWEGQP